MQLGYHATVASLQDVFVIYNIIVQQLPPRQMSSLLSVILACLTTPPDAVVISFWFHRAPVASLPDAEARPGRGPNGGDGSDAGRIRRRLHRPRDRRLRNAAVGNRKRLHWALGLGEVEEFSTSSLPWVLFLFTVTF